MDELMKLSKEELCHKVRYAEGASKRASQVIYSLHSVIRSYQLRINKIILQLQYVKDYPYGIGVNKPNRGWKEKQKR